MSERAAAIVIGASVSGLAAAAYLARAGRHTLLLEEADAPREPREILFALDPGMVRDLRLSARGLAFTVRDLSLGVGGDMPLSLGRDPRASASALARLSDADARAWPLYRQELKGWARRLGRWWQGNGQGSLSESLGRRSRDAFHRLCLTGADAWLGSRFETPALQAALLWDAGAGGFSVGEPGSALALVWRAAQLSTVFSGGIAKPGTLTAALRNALGMAQLRTGTRVTRILTKAGGVTGVVLADGSEIEADHVISALTRHRTLALAGLESGLPAIAEAKILLRLKENFLPEPAPIRHIMAERPEAYTDAHEAARAGRMAPDLPMEWVALSRDEIALTARPVPASLSGDQRAMLAAQAVHALSRALPGLAGAVTGLDIRILPGRARLADLLAPPASRLLTPVKGLFLAGEDAEPLPAVSGRAGRLAARTVLAR